MSSGLDQRGGHNASWFPFETKVLERLVDVMNDPSTSVAQLGAVIGWNPVLVRAVELKANAFCGLSLRVSDLNLALAALGVPKVKETVKLALASSAARQMVNSFRNLEELWNHSIACALLARAVALECKKCSPDDAFAAGLVHDAGLLILNDSAMNERGYRSIGNGGDEEGEGSLCGEVGEWMAKRWRFLPRGIAEVVHLHHTPGLAKENPVLTAVVHVADVLARKLGAGSTLQAGATEFDAGALAMLGFAQVDDQGVGQRNLVQAGELVPSLGLQVAVLREHLIKAVEDLSQDERYLLALHYYEGLSLGSVGSVMGLSEEQVTVLHARAIDQLHITSSIGELW